MKVKVRCCVAGCPETDRWHLLDYLYAVMALRSWQPYVCAKHHHLFDDVDISDYAPESEEDDAKDNKGKFN